MSFFFFLRDYFPFPFFFVITKKSNICPQKLCFPVILSAPCCNRQHTDIPTIDHRLTEGINCNGRLSPSKPFET